MDDLRKIRLYKIYILCFIVVLALTPVWMYLFWYLQKDKPVKVLIIDKTVADFPCQEHRGFNWILTYNRIVKPDKQLYDIYTDYFGFFPKEEKRFEIHDFEEKNIQQLDSIARAYNLLYFTDTYGVYYNEWYLDSLETEHSRKIYGGLTTNELILAGKFKEQGKLVISEFNTFASPTPRAIREMYEKMFDLKWSGWTCRYFDMLDTIRNPELPRWVVRLYKQQHNNEWNFHNSGLVFVHEDSRLFILENKTHLDIETPFIHTAPNYQTYYNLPDSVHYPFWFDITYSGNSNNIVSMYKIYPNADGQIILSKYRVPTTFPAVIEHIAPYKFFYFAGDFVDNPIKNYTAYFKGITTFDYFLYNSDLNDRTKFFWKYYNPLILRIMKDNKF